MISIVVPTKPGWIELETNPATLSLFNYNHGTDYRPLEFKERPCKLPKLIQVILKY